MSYLCDSYVGGISFQVPPVSSRQTPVPLSTRGADQAWGEIKTTESPGGNLSASRAIEAERPAHTSDKEHLFLFLQCLFVPRALVSVPALPLFVSGHLPLWFLARSRLPRPRKSFLRRRPEQSCNGCHMPAVSQSSVTISGHPRGRWAHVEAALQLTVAAQLYKHNLVERETDEIQGLRDRSTSILGIGHRGEEGGWESRAASLAVSRLAGTESESSAISGLAWVALSQHDYPGFRPKREKMEPTGGSTRRQYDRWDEV